MGVKMKRSLGRSVIEREGVVWLIFHFEMIIPERGGGHFKEAF